MTYEITIYTQHNKMYCEDCKPQGKSKRGTLVTSAYNHYCSGCGQDYREMAEREAEQKQEAK